MQRRFILSIVVVALLAGCSQILKKSDEGEFWEVAFHADQTVDAEETSTITLTYLEDPEDVVEFSFDSSTGSAVHGASLHGSGTFTSGSECSGCMQTPDQPIEVDIRWLTAEGDEFEESFTLD
ncbi:hypothetical protein [Geomicrobium sp. JCM 19038]|uniref:hypothetical protein n=1 Tax=Geomicrobium sp. JCM 19038 TaxID=1460635 RepID=UPI00045F2B61|nr:hypothetical protein [Geomicrobium sp. JCM 19038]GAK08288.1 hypothetical protein JCM19038_2065 [Geomicrobium sp. JCM 19038]